MSGPFYNAVAGTTGSTPGTAAFTPNAAVSGFRAWSTVPSGWWGLVRYEDGADWELAYSYWNGTTLSRSANQDVASSTGSPLSLSSAATASLVADGARVTPHLIIPWRGWLPIPGATTTPTAIGMPAVTVTGTAAAGTIAATNFLTRQPRVHRASVTTANGQCGDTSITVWATTSSTAGQGGWEFAARFGATTLPTGPRLYVGATSSNFIGQVIEPSAFVVNCAVFALDSTDTNIQLLVNSGAGGGTKTDTGIPLVVNGWYEAQIWSDPGSLTVKALLVRLDTGAIFYTETATDVPVTNTLLIPNLVGGLNGTNTGTAFTMAFGGMILRTGGW